MSRPFETCAGPNVNSREGSHAGRAITIYGRDISHSCTFQNGPAFVGLPLKFRSVAGTASILDVLYSDELGHQLGDAPLRLLEQRRARFA